MGSEPYSPSSLKQLIKHSLCIPCCFRKHHNHQSLHSNDDEKPRLTRTSSSSSYSSTQKSRRPHHHHHHHHHELLPEFKEKCKNFISRIGGGGRHSRRHSADFRYDASSYALNFDDGGGVGGGGGGGDAHSDECPLRCFSSRLPASPQWRSHFADNRGNSPC